MKVGILTLPLWNNYGGILQAYSLRLTVERLGHNAVLIDVQRDSLDTHIRALKQVKRWIKSKVLRIDNQPYYPNSHELKHISSKPRKFVERKIIPSSGHIPISYLSTYAKELDAIVVGSDQVWRPEYCPSLEAYFLNFTEKGLRKISYSASLGTSDWRFSPKQASQCGSLLKDFHSVSVRESSAIGLIKQHMNIDVTQVCDPTLLLEVSDYLEVAGIPDSHSSGGHGIFCYVLDPKEPRMQGLKEIGKEMSSEIFYIMPKAFDKNYQKSRKDYVFEPIESWIKAFYKCDFVITDSFHGCVFSIIFNKPFVAIANTDRGRTRFESLLAIFNLEERLFSSVKDIDLSILNKPLDWEKINEIRENEKKKGFQFLMDSLDICSK
ncbi:polysaccharide pyruvyl transferase family protein [Psychrobacter okhotskensis]|uniref:polysaccharide pyruvyl transferase family protein n=1 Tax=Psychrobacter okhotskensis TaxID=212403 RepID=UPI00191B4CB3|nr:polysaccharide pyruvyl transferase family protein [Psychrobacter okhotskensis]